MGRKKKIRKTLKKQKTVTTKKLAGQKIFKSNEEKIEIKKIKKQPNEKGIYSIKKLCSISKTWCWKNNCY